MPDNMLIKLKKITDQKVFTHKNNHLIRKITDGKFKEVKI